MTAMPHHTAASSAGDPSDFAIPAGFMTAWNIWAYALSSIATILFQIPSEMASPVTTAMAAHRPICRPPRFWPRPAMPINPPSY